MAKDAYKKLISNKNSLYERLQSQNNNSYGVYFEESEISRAELRKSNSWQICSINYCIEIVNYHN